MKNECSNCMYIGHWEQLSQTFDHKIDFYECSKSLHQGKIGHPEKGLETLIVAVQTSHRVSDNGSGSPDSYAFPREDILESYHISWRAGKEMSLNGFKSLVRKAIKRAGE